MAALSGNVWRRPAGWRRRGSISRWSTCGPFARSTPTPFSARSPKPIGPSWSGRCGKPEDSPPRSARKSWRGPSTTSTDRSCASAARRCRSPMQSTWRRRRSLRWRRSFLPFWRWFEKMVEFTMPILGADMLAATVVEWRKKPGDPVKRGEILAEIETDKGVIDVENFTDGTLEKILVETGTEVPVGTPLALIREAGAPAAPIPTGPPPEIPVPTGKRLLIPPQPSGGPGRLRISPLARKRAAELGVDPALLKGTGPGGAVTRDDVERAQAALKTKGIEAAGIRIQEPTLPDDQSRTDKAARMRQVIAAAMTRSKREVPHYYLHETIDMQRAVGWLAEENLRRPMTGRLLYGILLIKAVALALREVPELNAVWKEGKVVQSEAVHIGVAISLRQGGLVAPALHDADRQEIGTLMDRFRDLVQRARSGSLRSSEFSDPTITVTSLGEQGVEGIYPIIYPPQVAIVGFGKIVERPWVVEGKITARQVISASLAGDHRVTDGHLGGRFISAVDRLLQEPSRL